MQQSTTTSEKGIEIHLPRKYIIARTIPKNKVTAHHMAYRLRLGSEKHNTDYWFDYSKESIFSDNYKLIAKEIIDLWNEAENWWERDPYDQKNLRTMYGTNKV